MPDAAPVLADYDRALVAARRIVDRVGPDQWADPTPCTEWNVRQLVNHIAGGNLAFAAIANAERAAVPPTALDRAANHLGDDPSASFRITGEAAREAFSGSGFLERTFPTPFGEQPGRVIVDMRIVEMLVHGWDLARATGQPADLPDDLAQRSLAQWRRRMERFSREGSPFGPEQPAPNDAPAVERLAAFFGRPL